MTPDIGTSGRAGYGINTYSFIHTSSAFDCLERLADRGYRNFEIMLVPGHFWPGIDGSDQRQAITALVARRGLRILTLNQPNLDLNLGSLLPEMREYSCAVIARTIELAAEWNAVGVVINPGKANPMLPAPSAAMADAFRRCLDVLVPIARCAAVELIVKNHPLSYLYRAGELATFFDRHGWDQIGIGYDFANGFFGREAPEAVLGLGDHVRFLYAGDTGLGAFQHARIGTGAVAFDRISAMLGAAGWSRTTILEIVAADPEVAIEASVAHLEGVRWPGQRRRG